MDNIECSLNNEKYHVQEVANYASIYLGYKQVNLCLLIC